MSKLQAIRDLLAKPENWMQGEYTNSDNTCFCLLGALSHVYDEDSVALSEGDYHRDLDTLRNLTGGNIVLWNDAEERTHKDILALLDKALETPHV